MSNNVCSLWVSNTALDLTFCFFGFNDSCLTCQQVISQGCHGTHHKLSLQHSVLRALLQRLASLTEDKKSFNNMFEGKARMDWHPLANVSDRNFQYGWEHFSLFWTFFRNLFSASVWVRSIWCNTTFDRFLTPDLLWVYTVRSISS